MINKLVAEIKKKDAPVVVGLDPMLGYVPEHLTKKAFEEFGETLEGAAEAIWQYNKGIVDAVYDLIPAVKPQIAMYEQFGIPGMMAFKKTVDYCKEKGLVVIGDIKRGHIWEVMVSIRLLMYVRKRKRESLCWSRHRIRPVESFRTV